AVRELDDGVRRVLNDGRAGDNDRRRRLVVAIDGDVVDGRRHVEAADELAEDGLVEVEEALRADRDEELRAVGVLAGVGHAELAVAAVDELRVELVVEGEAGAAAAGAGRVAGLADEVLDDAVE